MLPSERGDMGEEIARDRDATEAQMLDGAIKIDRVPVDDHGSDKT